MIAMSPTRTSPDLTWFNDAKFGVLWFNVPEAVCQPLGTAIKLELDGSLDLYTGKGQVITQN